MNLIEHHSTCSIWTKLIARPVQSASIPAMSMLIIIIHTPAATKATSTRCHYQWHRLIVPVHLWDKSFEYMPSTFPVSDTALLLKWTQLTRKTKVPPPPPPPLHMKLRFSTLLIELSSCGCANIFIKELLLEELGLLGCTKVPLFRSWITQWQSPHLITPSYLEQDALKKVYSPVMPTYHYHKQWSGKHVQ